jgi:hypothetical protein
MTTKKESCGQSAEVKIEVAQRTRGNSQARTIAVKRPSGINTEHTGRMLLRVCDAVRDVLALNLKKTA